MDIALSGRGPRRRNLLDVDGGAPSFTGTASPRSAPGVEVSTPEPYTVPGFAPGAPTPGNFPNLPQPPQPTPQAPQTQAFQGLNQDAIMNYLRNLGSPSSASLRAAFPGMLEQGLIPQGSYLEEGATADDIFMPGFGWLDVLQGADTGSPGGWQYLFDGFGGGAGNYFSDPLLQGHLGFSQQVIDRLMQPQGMNPVLADAIAKLNQVFAQGVPRVPDFQNPGLSQFQQIADRRLSQLGQPLFGMSGAGTTAGATPSAAPPMPPLPSMPKPGEDWMPSADGSGWVPMGHPDAWEAPPAAPSAGGGDPTAAPSTAPVAMSEDAMRNSALLRTAFLEPLEAQRSARLEAEKLRLAGRGLTPESGLYIDQMADINRGFDQDRTTGYRDLMLQEIQANESREQEAVGIGQLLAGLHGQDVSGRRSAALQAATSGQGMSLSAAGQLAGIGQSMQGLDESRLLQALGISGNMAMMPFQAMNAGLGALNQLQGGFPQDDTGTLIQLLMTLANQGEGVNANAQGQDQAFWNSIINAIPGIVGAFQPQTA